MAGSESEIGGHQHHRDRGLPEIEVEDPLPLGGSLRRDEGDGGGGVGYVPRSLPYAGQLAQQVAVGDNNEVPRLPIAGRW